MSKPISLTLMSMEARVETVPFAVRKMMGHFKGVWGTLTYGLLLVTASLGLRLSQRSTFELGYQA
jgi:hypothetical protein